MRVDGVVQAVGVRVQQRCQMFDVGGGQPQRVQLTQLRVGRHPRQRRLPEGRHSRRSTYMLPRGERSHCNNRV